ncbi:unnamed protein product [Bursaphelenchus okinawaensis]|uniref:Rho-GAP domain-containing protein n=1 Tax=Bursaphelenchus okinawaensis TaxID=465554 RepID=A0A811K0M0_9BILA|nr:unnamed protein product [Bursaphelenchus okinawaensis]CAG9088205.1 unnamed protein product [Bursaphelenchus okinawaensis]
MTVATYGMVICGTDDLHHRYRGRIEKVKFGVPISEAFSHDIPATLLVLLLKVNKEGPLKKDIWRAPGNQAQVRKLSHIMQHGRLVNISHISVYTAQPDSEQQRQIFCRAISSLSIPSQHLLVLLFGTFRIIADSAETFNTRMSSDAIGISVAPSLFHTCIHDGQRAKLEDVMRFKLASQVISVIIKSFGFTNLFPRECYEFYARITGRTLHVGDDWNFTFQYPSRTFSQPEIYPSREDEKDDEEEETDDQPGPSGLQKATAREHHTDPAITEAEVTDVEEEDLYSECLPAYQSILHSARGRASSSGGQRWSKQELGSFADLKEQQRLSYSMGEVMLSRPDDEYEIERRRLCLTTLRSGNDSVESTRSLTYLEWVHEKQTKRMRTRSEWFLSPVMPQKNNGNSKSVEFKANKYIVETTMTRDISPMTLKIPEIEMNRQSSNEEMRTVSSLTSSQSPSSSVEQQQPSPMPIDSGTEEQSEKDDTVVPLNISSTGETTPRLPFQMIQHQSGDDDDTPIVATPPARQHPPMFFAGELETGLKIKPQHSSSSSSSNHSQTSVVHSSPTPKRSGLNRVSSMGVVRRKSWRKHYVRPNKSLDQEGSPKEPEPGRTSQSTPIRYPSSNSVRRPSDPEQAETSVLTRRKSSGSNSKAKAPIQTRKSTHL